MSQDYIVSYSDFGIVMGKLTKQLEEVVKEKSLKYIVPIPNGGLAIALHLSKNLKLELIDVQRFDEDIRIIPDFTLMVDDLCDSGKTMMWHSTADVWTCTTAAIYVKEQSEFRPDYFVEQIPSEYWVRWPWEDPKEIPNRPGYEGD